MNLFKDFTNHIRKIVKDADFEYLNEKILSNIVVEPPRDSGHGDLATNAAMVLAKPLKMAPRKIAEKLVGGLNKIDSVKSAEIAGPGFINIRLDKSVWAKQLEEILAAEQNFGRDIILEDANSPRPKVNVEYVSANPTGPMHVGHCRGAVVGDALANLLAYAGFDVTKEYVINDAGGQITVLANSVLLRYREALGEDIGEIPEGYYPGEYLVPVGKKLAEAHGDKLFSMDEEKMMAVLKDTAIEEMMAMIKGDLNHLNVHHDLFFSERQLHEKKNGVSEIDRILKEMTEKGYVYKGKLPAPKGELPDDWEDREQTLFRSTDVGDDMDRALIKSDGSYTYFAADVAYFQNKFDRGFERMIFVLGADHGGYVKRLKAVAKAIAGDKAQLDVLLCQLVKLLRNSEPVKMGKRAGNFVTLREVVDEVGVDAVRFMMLYRKAEAPLDFDFAKVTEQSKDNPVFYVQYAHARCCSVLRQAAVELKDTDLSSEALKGVELTLLEDPGELQLIKTMAEFPRMIEQAVKADEPHRVAFYLYELASELHTHWSKGKESPELRFINLKSANMTLARLAMLRAVAGVLSAGLSIIGASAPEEMR